MRELFGEFSHLNGGENSPTKSRIEPPNSGGPAACQSPESGNEFSLSPRERVGVRVSVNQFISKTLLRPWPAFKPLRFGERIPRRNRALPPFKICDKSAEHRLGSARRNILQQVETVLGAPANGEALKEGWAGPKIVQSRTALSVT